MDAVQRSRLRHAVTGLTLRATAAGGAAAVGLVYVALGWHHTFAVVAGVVLIIAGVVNGYLALRSRRRVLRYLRLRDRP